MMRGEAVWRVYTNSTGRTVEAREGKLFITAVDPGWRQKGIMLRRPLDLTGKTTTIEIEYAQTGFNEQNPGFWADPAIEADDTWNHPGFRLTVGTAGIGPAFTPPSDGFWSSTAGIMGLTAPYRLRWTLTHTGGSRFDAVVEIDGERRYTGTLDVGSLDPAALYFYLYVSNNDQGGPAVIDRISIRQTEPM